MSSSSILSDRVSRAIQVRTDTPAMKAALEALAGLSSVDSRSVRVAMEQDALQQARLLQEQLRVLVDEVQSLRLSVGQVAEIATRVQTALATSVIDGDEQALAGDLAQAFVHRDEARQRLSAVEAFLETFDLSPSDSRLLDHYAFEDLTAEALLYDETSSSLPNGLAFLSALERVRKIRTALVETFGTTGDRTSDAKGLGAGSALRMMESLAEKQESAYERLYHWLQRYLHLSSSSEADLESLDEALQHDFVRRSFYTLRHVPAFYAHTLELVAASRRSEATRRFLLALTSGYQGAPPMEMKSHDAVAYVGDMLAFCFRAFSVEADVARGLLEYQPPEWEDEPQPETREEAGEEDFLIEKPMTAAGMLAISMSGLSRPLKSRILQVIGVLARRDDDSDFESDDGMRDDLEEESAVVRNRLTHLYEICGLLLFYQAATHKGVDKLHASTEELTANPLVACLNECLVQASQGYEATMRVYCASMEHLSSVTGESEAALAHAMLVLITNVRRHSPGFATDIECPSECRDCLSLEWVTTTLVEAALAVCKSLDDAVVLKQAVMVAKKASMRMLEAERLDEAVDQKESQLIDALVDAKSLEVLDLCGLGPVAAAYHEWKTSEHDGVPMAGFAGLSQEEMETSMKEFYASLFSPPLPSLETTIKDPLLRKMARSKIARRVCETYQELYESIMSKGGYDDVRFLGHRPDQVDTLFSA